MKHMSAKKICISVAAACLLVSGITVFAGGAAYFVAGSSMEAEYTDYRELDKAQKELGYAVDSVERFENGYSFNGMSVDTIGAYTEESGKMYSIPAFNIRYQKDGKKIDLNVNEKTGDDVLSKEPNATRMCGDIELRCDEYTDKIVPDSYELTEEDKINEQRDDYNIVYMSVTVQQKETDENYVISPINDEVCIQHRMVVSWEKDGKSYNLAGTDLDMSAEEMLDMAEEILTAE